tara:strand:+ start:544 stop:1098 length:555 start_codon:yes stop_codon:yes gene_type:complete
MTNTTLTTPAGAVVTLTALTTSEAVALQRFNRALSPGTRRRFLPHAYDSATVAKIIARAETGVDYTVVLLDGKQIVGYAFLWDVQDPVPVLGIGLADAFQGKGLGQALMKHLIDVAREQRAEGIELTTLPDNDGAFALYLKMGFTYLGDTMNLAGDGRNVQERVMFLPLKADAKPPVRQFGPPV